jgi:MFS family permease
MNPWKGITEIPRNIWHISVASLVNRTGMMVLPFLALYLTQEMGESPAAAGLVLTAYGLGGLISAPFVGKLSDQIGALKLMRLSLFASGVCLLIYPFLENYYAILFYSVLLAVVTESFRPASMAFISDAVNSDMRKPAFALYRLAINFGMSIGPVLGGFLTSIDFSLLFYVDGITTILAAIYLSVVKWDKIIHNEKEDKNTIKPLSPAYRDYRFIYFLMAMTPVVMVFFQHISTMPIFIVEELGFSRFEFGVLVSVNTVLIILIELPINNWMKNWKDWKLLFYGAVLTGIGFGMMAYIENITPIIISIVIWTFGEMIFFPSASSLVAEMAPQGKRGEYMGLLQMMFSFAFTLAPWLGTTVYEIYGSQFLWIGTFGFGLISAIMLIKLKRF